MASPQYSTPFSLHSYPTYTPLSVAPVKGHGSPAHSSGGTAAVDHAAHPHLSSFSVSRSGTGWPAPDVGVVSAALRSDVSAAAPQPTRVNALLYAPPVAVTTARTPAAAASTTAHAYSHFSDIHNVRTLTSAVPSVHHARRAGRAVAEAGADVVDVESDVVSVSEAAPNLCAFRDECHNLLALLRASSPQRHTAATPSPGPRPGSADAAPTPAVASLLLTRQLPHVPTTRSSSVSVSPPPSSHVPLLNSGAASASPVPTVTYAQLMREMDDLADLLADRAEEREQTPRAAALQPTRRDLPERAGTPEKLHRSTRRTSPSPLLAPSAAELVHAPASPFWTAQLLKWIVYLVERRQCTLQRLETFEDVRAPDRRGACAADGADGAEAAAERVPSATRLTHGLLRLLRSLDPATSDVNAWTAAQQRHMCTRAANLLAEMCAAEERVMADLLNDAAAGATLEREGAVSAPAATVPELYRQDMADTIALLEQLSQENTALRRQLTEAHAKAAKHRESAKRERAARAEVGEHVDRLVAENSALTAELREAEAGLRQAEALTRPVPQEEVLRNQLERQTLHLRDTLAELNDVRDESDTLRRTVLHLRDTLVRHRAVIDLLTRRRRERERAAAAVARRSGSYRGLSPGPESPPMQLIEDILSGACDPPSSASTSVAPQMDLSVDADAVRQRSCDQLASQ
ncbi:hypothetical protein NESM_000250400 [Novymonas esmeraldas]|uniref:Uncharacterized protein n=1 Tax=Novymonas esmeraldas TaxID=1808958 RepID=A0AAW0F723_9TRYP